MKKIMVMVNDRGLRIGESHHKAVLTDAEVAQLFIDRGPEDAPLMSLSALALRWGMSKSGVKGIIDGRRRGVSGTTTKRVRIHDPKQRKVRVKLTVSLHHRAKLHRLGGAAWLKQMIEQA